jgi:crotonobetainyl-CoA:carnitine CoA-transferase CaiB-like acyl-CoA transferase
MEDQVREQLLDGLTVLDLTQVVSGSLATMLMADYGANVIKIEPPGGELYRSSGRMLTSDTGESNTLNILRFSRGKRSVVIDLKSEEGKELFLGLVATADVVVENFRPGVMSRLGIDYDELLKVNDNIIYTSVSGYGGDAGKYRERPAFALTVEATAGLTHLAGTHDGPPVWMGFAMVDIFTGTLAFTGTLLAINKRQHTGEGSRVEIAMLDSAFLMNELALTDYALTGCVTERGAYAMQAPWGPYPTKDGHVVIAVLSDRQWAALCQLIGHPELAADERFLGGVRRSLIHDESIGPLVEHWAQNLTKENAADLLAAAGVPAAPVNDARDVFEKGLISTRDMLMDVDDAVLGTVNVVANPIQIRGHGPDGTPQGPPIPRIPGLGEHTFQVLKQSLNLSDEQCRDLSGRNIIGSNEPS